MKKKPVQYYSKEYVEQCKNMTPEQIILFLEGFRKMVGGKPEKAKLISIKVPPSLLTAFKAKAEGLGIPYQTQIKTLMREWLEGTS